MPISLNVDDEDELPLSDASVETTKLSVSISAAEAAMLS
jgi:hypothetical protein